MSGQDLLPIEVQYQLAIANPLLWNSVNKKHIMFSNKLTLWIRYTSQLTLIVAKKANMTASQKFLVGSQKLQELSKET